MRRPGAWRFSVVCPIAVVLLVGVAAPAAGQVSDEDSDARASDDDRLSLPPGPATDVTIVVDVNKVLNVTERDNAFDVDAQLTASWSDKRLGWEPCPSDTARVYKDEGALEKLKTDVWTPGFQVVDGRARRQTTALAISIGCTGAVTYQERFAVSVFQRFDGLNDYPFDDQTLLFTIVPNGLGQMGAIRFVAPENYVARPDWNSEEWVFHIEPGDQRVDSAPPAVTTAVRAERRSKYYVVNVVAPLVLIVLVSWSVFWMDLKLHERLGVAITALLTVVAFDFLTSDSLPKLTFTTRLDAFYNVSYIFVALTILISVVATRPSRQPRNARDTDDDDDDEVGPRPAETPTVAGANSVDAEPAPEVQGRDVEVPATATVGRGGPTGTWRRVWAWSKGVRGRTIDRWARRVYPVLYLLLVGVALVGWFSPGEARELITESEVEREFSDIESAFGFSPTDLEADAELLPLDEETPGSIDAEGENDIFRFCVDDNGGLDAGRWSVKSERTGSTDDFLDPQLLLFTETGRFVTSNDDRTDRVGDTSSLIIVDVSDNPQAMAGPALCYILVANDSTGSEMGRYVLTRTADEFAAGEFVGGEFEDLQATFGVSADDLSLIDEELRVGSVSGSIDQAGAYGVSRLCIDASLPVSVEMLRSNPDDSMLDPLLLLYSHTGSLVALNDDNSEIDLDSRLTLDGLQHGCYFLIAADLSGTETGEYTLVRTDGVVAATED